MHWNYSGAVGNALATWYRARHATAREKNRHSRKGAAGKTFAGHAQAIHGRLTSRHPWRLTVLQGLPRVAL